MINIRQGLVASVFFAPEDGGGRSYATSVHNDGLDLRPDHWNDVPPTSTASEQSGQMTRFDFSERCFATEDPPQPGRGPNARPRGA